MNAEDELGLELEMAKFHVYGVDKEFVGSLSCRAKDIVQRRLSLSGELNIKVSLANCKLAVIRSRTFCSSTFECRGYASWLGTFVEGR